MARIARVVAPGIPHHVTQRGNRRQQTFFNDEDYQTYLVLMSEWCLKYDVKIWAYCLMPNHIPLIAVPQTKQGLNLAIGEAHRRYTRRTNFREGWQNAPKTGHGVVHRPILKAKTLSLQIQLLCLPWSINLGKNFYLLMRKNQKLKCSGKTNEPAVHWGGSPFIEQLEVTLERRLKLKKPGPTRRDK